MVCLCTKSLTKRRSCKKSRVNWLRMMSLWILLSPKKRKAKRRSLTKWRDICNRKETTRKSDKIKRKTRRKRSTKIRKSQRRSTRRSQRTRSWTMTLCSSFQVCMVQTTKGPTVKAMGTVVTQAARHPQTASPRRRRGRRARHTRRSRAFYLDHCL